MQARLSMLSKTCPAAVTVYLASHAQNHTSPLGMPSGIWLAGKSTLLKQVALLTVMAQIGYFVPAEYALFRISDRLCTRVSKALARTHAVTPVLSYLHALLAVVGCTCACTR